MIMPTACVTHHGLPRHPFIQALHVQAVHAPIPWCYQVEAVIAPVGSLLVSYYCLSKIMDPKDPKMGPMMIFTGASILFAYCGLDYAIGRWVHA